MDMIASMIRLQPRFLLAGLAVLCAAAVIAPASAAPAKQEAADDDAPAGKKGQTSKAKSAKGKDAKAKDTKGKDSKGKDAKSKDSKGKPVQVANFGDWGAFVAHGKSKTCYALAKPSSRAPASLKRDDAYIFISSRPAENVRNEVSVIMGFPMKDNAEPKADVGGTAFDLVAKGSNAWVKNPAQESQFIEALRRGSKLVVKASSARGNASTDTYSLGGLSDSLARVQKECP